VIRNDGYISYTRKIPSSAEMKIKIRAPVSEISDAFDSLTSLNKVEPSLTLITDVGTTVIKARCDGHIYGMECCELPPWMKEFCSIIRSVFEDCHVDYIPWMLCLDDEDDE